MRQQRFLSAPANSLRHARHNSPNNPKSAPSSVAFTITSDCCWRAPAEGQRQKKAHRRALDLYEKLAETKLSSVRERYRRQELMWTHENLGHVLTDSNRPQEAEKAFRQAIALGRQLNTEFPNQGYIGWIAKNSDSLTMLLIRLSQWDKAAAEYAKANLLARPLRR